MRAVVEWSASKLYIQTEGGMLDIVSDEHKRFEKDEPTSVYSFRNLEPSAFLNEAIALLKDTDRLQELIDGVEADAIRSGWDISELGPRWRIVSEPPLPLDG